MTTKLTNPSGKMPLRWGGEVARIAVIPGDGIGKEVTPEAVKVIRAVTAKTKRPMEFVEFDWGADKYLKEGDAAR
jgi:isocitrate/isopropylmalate dehydrogenase